MDAPIHNSPMKPFGSCGFELLRVLGLEFSLRTRTEAICLRSEVMKKDYRIDTKGIHVVSDLLRAMAVETCFTGLALWDYAMLNVLGGWVGFLAALAALCSCWDWFLRWGH